ncbi:hypothetical protein SAMN05660337_2196 [Maridesulfovibrio ferrireducens]|uniref:DUF465 domain-containing protein n=1 Tax=Maridesulfovibrio ferrireducens TaxID=246191 RepID=A0A1G9HK81_9BACT|nr:DUF465 domain-containing protein [Maridesulfovibrio ferrireducens]SDL13144.1 hypothetical protein SAMN05660337_2196 [Maridesulfovibrio ferrireducens]
MEAKDVDLIRTLVGQDAEIKGLWDQHLDLKKIIDRFEKKGLLNETEVLELKELKKKKLSGKTKLHLLIEKYK